MVSIDHNNNINFAHNKWILYKKNFFLSNLGNVHCLWQGGDIIALNFLEKNILPQP